MKISSSSLVTYLIYVMYINIIKDMKTIKFYNLSDLNKKYTKRFVNQFYKLNKIGRYILGANTEKFEKNFAKFCKAIAFAKKTEITPP